MSLGLSLGLTGGGRVRTRLLSGDGGAVPVFQATYGSAFYRLNGATAALGGSYARSGNAWDRRGLKYAANTLRRTGSGALIEKSQQNFAGAVSGVNMFTSNNNATRADGVAAPDRETLACAVTSTATNGSSARNVTITGNTTDPHITAAFVQKASTSTVSNVTATLTGGTTVTGLVTFNRLTGTGSNGTGEIYDAGDWWAVAVPATQNGTNNTNLGASFRPVDSGAGEADAWALNVYKNESLFTSPVVATATRSADNFTHTTASLGVDANAAATYVAQWSDARTPRSGTSGFIVCIDDGTASNRIALYLDANGYVNLEVTAGGVQQCLITGSVKKVRGGRAAFAIASNDVALYVDGTQVGTDSSVTLPSGLTTWRHGHDHTPANHLNGYLTEEAAFSGRQTNGTLASLSARTADQPFLSQLSQWYAGGVSGKTVIFWGDSTTSNATTLFSTLNSRYGATGRPLAGVTFTNRGSNGQTLQNAIADAGANGLAAIATEAANLYVICYGINDVRLGARTQAQLVADLTTAVNYLRTNVPTADILLWGPNSFLTTDVGGNGFVSPNASAQTYTDILYNAYESLRGTWANVAVLQKQATQHNGIQIFPRTCPATSVWMTDQLHPSPIAQSEEARQIGDAISP